MVRLLIIFFRPVGTTSEDADDLFKSHPFLDPVIIRFRYANPRRQEGENGQRQTDGARKQARQHDPASFGHRL